MSVKVQANWSVTTLIWLTAVVLTVGFVASLLVRAEHAHRALDKQTVIRSQSVTDTP